MYVSGESHVEIKLEKTEVFFFFLKIDFNIQRIWCTLLILISRDHIFVKPLIRNLKSILISILLFFVICFEYFVKHLGHVSVSLRLKMYVSLRASVSVAKSAQAKDFSQEI
jgi:hypothetical protein